MSEPVNREFAELWLKTIDEKYEVHQLFNDWWRFAPEDVKAKYVEDFRSIPEQKAFVASDYYAEPLDMDKLAALPEGTMGKTYHKWIVENDLEPKISMNYRQFHNMLVASGQLDGMPEEVRYAILRGFQVHDFLHVVTGYSSDGISEIKLQAFCLAQLKFPYFAMWVSVVTARMTFRDPDAIVPLMDAISEGWQLGRQVRNLQFEEWEKRIEEPLEAVRKEFAIAPEGCRPLAA